MSSSFSGLYIGLSGLRTQQSVQEMISHNVANVNTPGFSRQDATLVTLPPNGDFGRSQNGTGVNVSAIRRSASMLLNQQIGRETAVLGQWEALRDGTNEVQQLFNEPGGRGLQASIDDFWGAWRDLAVDPTSNPARTNVVQIAETMAGKFAAMSRGLTDFTNRLDLQVETQAGQLNQLASEVVIINHQIMQAVANGNLGNDLRDQRDYLVEQIEKIAHVASAENKDGSLSVSIGGHMLVSSAGATEIKVERGVKGGLEAVWSDDHTGLVAGTGQLAANQMLRAWVTEEVTPTLDQLAQQMITQVNALHKGTAPDGTVTGPYDFNDAPGENFFQGNSASTLAINPNIAADPSKIAIAKAQGAPGDGSVALEIAQLQQKRLDALHDTIGGAYASLAGDAGLMGEKADQMATQQGQLLDFLEGRRQELAGVSLDEEAVRMLGSQKAYQAAARVITAVDEMLDTLINRTGLVGR